MPNDHESSAGGNASPAYHAFLIRFWRSAPGGRWHATLQRTTHEPAIHFAGIDLLFAHLLMQLGEETPPGHLLQGKDGDDAAPSE